MRFYITILCLLFTLPLFSQQIPVMNYEELEKRLHTNSDTTYVVNFWATWCKPCVEELPAFFEVEKAFADQKFKLLLVSLDFSTHIDTRVTPFITKNNITCDVIVLDDPDANNWIPRVNNDWDGSIPVTLIFNKNERLFFKGTMNSTTLTENVNKLIFK